MTTKTTPCPLDVEHLTLAVMSDGASYSLRVGAAMHALTEGPQPTRFRAVVEPTFRALRRQFDFRPAAPATTIKAAAAEVEARMVDHLLDSARAGYTGERARLYVRHWTDRQSGTGYVSAQLRIPVRLGSMPCGSCGDGEIWVGIPLTTGDTGAAESAARRALTAAGIDYPHPSFDIIDRGPVRLSDQFRGLARFA